MLAHPVCKWTCVQTCQDPYACARTASARKRTIKLPPTIFQKLPPPAVKTVCKAISSSFSFRDPFLSAHGFLFNLDAENFQVCSGAAVGYETLIKHPLEVLWKHLWFLGYWCTHVEWRYISGPIMSSFQDTLKKDFSLLLTSGYWSLETRCFSQLLRGPWGVMEKCSQALHMEVKHTGIPFAYCLNLAVIDSPGEPTSHLHTSPSTYFHLKGGGKMGIWKYIFFRTDMCALSNGYFLPWSIFHYGEVFKHIFLWAQMAASPGDAHKDMTSLLHMTV